ncbi:hypothetical protein ACFX1R_048928 [Malus domestica]
MKNGRHMLSGEGVAASSTRFKSKRRSEGPDIFKGVEKRRGRTNQDLRSARMELLLVNGASEIEEAFTFSKDGLLRDHETFAFSKVGLLKDHEGRSQKSKRRLLSQKLGCSETTRANLRNRRGTYFSSLVSTCQLCGNYGHYVEDFW